MLDVEAQSRIRMEDMGKREPLLSKTRHMLPCNPALLAATTNDARPALAHLKPEAPEAGDIPGHCMVVEVALDHALQPLPDFRQWLVHSPPKRNLYLFQFGKESRSDGFAQHEEPAVLPGLPTYVGEPQEVERLRLSLTPSLSVLGSKPPELDQACFVRM
jgi:hypothetical protein